MKDCSGHNSVGFGSKGILHGGAMMDDMMDGGGVIFEEPSAAGLEAVGKGGYR